MEKEEILVSIVCNTYNHGEYIREALDSFVQQETSFRYEVCIYDDASTDCTPDIIKEFEQRYPDKINAICQTENQYSKGLQPAAQNKRRARGKYLAMCEGDDCWCDPGKLQKMITFLEEHPDYSMAVHNTMKIDGAGTFLGRINSCEKEMDYDCDAIIAAGGSGLFHFSSFVFQKSLFQEMPMDVFTFKNCGDYPLAIYMAMKGKIHYFPEIMSHYRRMVPGSWTVRSNTIQKRIDSEKANLSGLEQIDVYSGRRYRRGMRIAKGRALFFIYLYEKKVLRGLRHPGELCKIVRFVVYHFLVEKKRDQEEK